RGPPGRPARVGRAVSRPPLAADARRRRPPVARAPRPDALGRRAGRPRLGRRRGGAAEHGHAAPPLRDAALRPPALGGARLPRVLAPPAHARPRLAVVARHGGG